MSLQGKALIWSCYDPSGVILAAAHSILLDLLRGKTVRPYLLLAESPSQVIIESPTLVQGLAIWRMQDANQLVRTGQAIQSCQNRVQRPICLVYCDPRLLHATTILCEAGAQMVVSQVPSLQSALEQLLPKVALSDRGVHPLTSGLLDRLPWPGWDSAELAAEN